MILSKHIWIAILPLIKVFSFIIFKVNFNIIILASIINSKKIILLMKSLYKQH